jgi:hypothetical protein
MSEMPEVTGTFLNGHVELDSRVDWPNGLRVTVAAAATRSRSPGSNGAFDDAWGIDEAHYEDTPEFRAEILRRIDAVEPLELTPDEEREWQEAMKWIGDYTLEAVKRDMGRAP